MAARSVLACISLIAFTIASQPALAANDDNPPVNPSTTSPSTSPAKRPHRHHSRRHRHQQPSPQDNGAPATNG
jgi:hypothetical protein